MFDYKYHISLEYQTDADGEQYWVATTKEFRTLIGTGETIDEAINDLNVVIGIAVEHLMANNLPIPEPLQEEAPLASGRFTVRTGKTLHQQLIKEAEADGLSLNQYLLRVLAERDAHVSPRIATG